MSIRKDFHFPALVFVRNQAPTDANGRPRTVQSFIWTTEQNFSSQIEIGHQTKIIILRQTSGRNFDDGPSASWMDLDDRKDGLKCVRRGQFEIRIQFKKQILKETFLQIDSRYESVDSSFWFGRTIPATIYGQAQIKLLIHIRMTSSCTITNESFIMTSPHLRKNNDNKTTRYIVIDIFILNKANYLKCVGKKVT